MKSGFCQPNIANFAPTGPVPHPTQDISFPDAFALGTKMSWDPCPTAGRTSFWEVKLLPTSESRSATRDGLSADRDLDKLAFLEYKFLAKNVAFTVF